MTTSKRMEPGWREAAQARLDRIIAHGDDMGDIANASGDDLRDILTVFAQRLATLDAAVEAEAHAHRSRVARQLLTEGGGPPVLFDLVKQQHVRDCGLCQAARPFKPAVLEVL